MHDLALFAAGVGSGVFFVWWLARVRRMRGHVDGIEAMSRITVHLVDTVKAGHVVQSVDKYGNIRILVGVPSSPDR